MPEMDNRIVRLLRSTETPTMNRFTVGCSLGLLLLSIAPINAQDIKTFKDDTSAVRATVTDYIEGYFTGDAQRMARSLHPHYLKHMIHGSIPIREKTGEQMVAEIQKNGPADLAASRKNERITVLDIAGDIASAKLVTPGWTDYMTLSKVNGDWKILSVVQRID
jgi:hypothetical protein